MLSHFVSLSSELGRLATIGNAPNHLALRPLDWLVLNVVPLEELSQRGLTSALRIAWSSKAYASLTSCNGIEGCGRGTLDRRSLFIFFTLEDPEACLTALS